MLVSVARFFNICQRSTNKANTNIWSTKVLNCYVINNSLFFCLIMYLVQSYSLWFFSFFQKFVLVQVYVMTFIFVITWQFAQFALLLHSLLCFILATAQLLNKDQVRILKKSINDTHSCLRNFLIGHVTNYNLHYSCLFKQKNNRNILSLISSEKVAWLFTTDEITDNLCLFSI